MGGLFVMPFVWQIYFIYFYKVRESGTQQRVRTRTQFESNLPKGWQVEPVPVEAEKNDRLVEDPYEVFKALVELSGTEKTPEQILKELDVSKFTDAEGNDKWFANRTMNWLTGIELPYRFLLAYYDGHYAFVKVWDREIYGQVKVENHWQFKMPTRLWTLVMPYVYIRTSNENVECFFPLKALLTWNEQGLFAMYRQCGVQIDERDQLEKQILADLVKLSTVKKPATVIESNKVFADIEQLCQSAGTIKSVGIHDWKLYLTFDWRIATDNSGEEPGLALPPFELSIDLNNGVVRWNRETHPHIMSDLSLCMGGTLRDLAQRCVANKDLYALVSWMVQFGDSWTSEDVWGWSRHPSNCIRRYFESSADALEEVRGLPAEMIRAIWNTYHYKFNDHRDFFVSILADNQD